MKKSNKILNIYLAGGIMGLTLQDADIWRKNAIKKLKKYNCLNPLRRNYIIKTFQSSSEIVNLDKNDINKSDILLVNISKPSWGTAMELIYGWERGKIIICFGKKYNQCSPWIKYHSTRIFEKFDNAINYIKNNF